MYQNVSLDNVHELSPPDGVEVPLDQFHTALDVAEAIIESGSVGDVEQYRFYIHVYGHANPDHNPRDGWANDGITVNVAQAPKVA